MQVPMDRTLKLSAQAVAESQGFNSLQDAVRLFLANLASRRISAAFSSVEPDEILTPAQEKVLMRKYLQAKKELASGKLKSYTNVEDMMRDLRN